MKAQVESGSLVNPTRRDALKFSAAAIASASLPKWARAAATAQISGIAFDDCFGDGMKRYNARGIAGVLVSNGVDVVRTGGDGRYCLPLCEGQQAFVIKPAQYQTRIAAQTNLPLHYSDAMLAPSETQHDFALTRTDVLHRFEAIMMADPQPENDRHLDFIRDGALPLLAKARASFGLTLGDIVGDELSLMARYNSIIGQAGTPWWNAGGNHDLDFDAPDHFGARRSFRRAYGPATYAFEQGEALFIVLDNVEYGGCHSPGYRGCIGPRQLAFVRNLLAHIPREKLIVLAMHIPLRTEWNPASARDNTADTDALLQLLAGRRAVSFSGHMHAAEHQYLPYRAGDFVAHHHHHHVLAALSGSWWSGPYDHRGRPVSLGVDGCPPGFHVLHVDGANYTTSFTPLHASEPRMRTFLSRCAPCRQSGAFVIDGPASAQDMPCEIITNVFDGGPRTQVRMRVPQGEWQALARTRRADPFMLDHFAQPGAERHGWIKAEPCEHLWTAAMPRLSAGLHRVEIEGRDEYGQMLRDVKIVEVSAS